MTQTDRKKKWRASHPEQRKASYRRTAKRHQDKLKKQIYDHYGFACACCGETEEFFLTIGHIGGWGAAHRKALGAKTPGGKTLCVWRDIVKRGFPDDIRIECANCNFGAA